MTSQTKKILFVALTMAMVATFAGTSVSAEGNTELTRTVSDEEFHLTQMEVLDLRTELNKIQSGFIGASDLEKKLDLDSKIAQLMPILDKYQKQQFAKHHIEPTRKAQLVLAESNLRESIAKLGIDSYAVNLNTVTKTIEVVTDDPKKNEQVRVLIDSHVSANITTTLENGNFEIVDYACADQ